MGDVQIMIRTTVALAQASSEHSPISDESLRTASPTEPVRLSEYLRTRQAGLLSLGTLVHHKGACKPCAFENRRQHLGGSACFKGALCERCHEWHPDERKRKRSEQKQKKQSLRASESNAIDLSSN